MSVLDALNGWQLNDKPTTMQSRSVARSQCSATVWIGTGLLSAPNVNGTDDNYPEKSLLWDPNWDPTAGFSRLIVFGTLNIWYTKRSGPYPYYCLRCVTNRNIFIVKMFPYSYKTANMNATNYSHCELRNVKKLLLNIYNVGNLQFTVYFFLQVR